MIEMGCRAASAARSREAEMPRFLPALGGVATIGGVAALQIDAVLGPGAESCRWPEPELSGTSPLLLRHAAVRSGADRARLHLLDLPAGSGARVLALVAMSDEDSLETVLGFAAPIIESVEFHAP